MNAPLPSTSWTAVAAARDGDEATRSEALARLASLYWTPIHETIRREWHTSSEEAADLTQEFFSMFFEKRVVEGVVQGRGSFRGYVRATLRNFLLAHRRSRLAWKRGGCARARPLEDLVQLGEATGGHDSDPCADFDRAVMRSILQRALDDLEEECRRESRTQHFRLFRDYYLGGEPGRYDELRERFGLGPHDVKNRLASMRTRLRARVLGRLRDGVRSEDELVSEMFEVLAG